MCYCQLSALWPCWANDPYQRSHCKPAGNKSNVNKSFFIAQCFCYLRYLAKLPGTGCQCEDPTSGCQTAKWLWTVSLVAPPGAFCWALVCHGKRGSLQPQSWRTSVGSGLFQHLGNTKSMRATLILLKIVEETLFASNKWSSCTASATYLRLAVLTFFHILCFTAMLFTSIIYSYWHLSDKNTSEAKHKNKIK